ncbi:MAG: WxcM-like domain-containing protein [Patescibacteria group bacterium]
MIIIGKIEPIRGGDDDRRMITAYESKDGEFEITYFVIRKTMGAPLGNHYHREKKETFLILNGSGILTYADVVEVNNKVRLYLEKPDIIELHEGTVVQILPYTAHAFRLEEGSVMVCFSDKAFNANDMPFCKVI